MQLSELMGIQRDIKLQKLFTTIDLNYLFMKSPQRLNYSHEKQFEMDSRQEDASTLPLYFN